MNGNRGEGMGEWGNRGREKKARRREGGKKGGRKWSNEWKGELRPHRHILLLLLLLLLCCSATVIGLYLSVELIGNTNKILSRYIKIRTLTHRVEKCKR